MNYKDIIKRIKNSGHNAYLVGGAVRDILLKKKPKDFDVVTSMQYNDLCRLFSDCKLNVVGRQFQVLMIGDVEVATYRVDEYENGNLIGTVPVTSLKTDLARRDLTINSMAMDIETKEIIDPFNGRDDLKRRIIRFTGDAEKRINEDPARILRACRFLSNLKFRFAEGTFFALSNNSHLIQKLPMERVNTEIIKAMDSQYASVFFRALQNINILKDIFPSLYETIGLDGGKYHDETVFEHSLDCGDYYDGKNKMLKLACYLHDVGKPLAYLLGCIGSFHSHHKIGAKKVREELTKLKFKKVDIDYITNLIKVHMSTFDMDTQEKTVRKLLVRLNNLNIHYTDFLHLRFADHASNRTKEGYTEFEKNEFVDKFANVINKKAAFSIKDLEINGNDIMKILNIKPGPIVGEILKDLFDEVVEKPELNNRGVLFEKVRKL